MISFLKNLRNLEFLKVCIGLVFSENYFGFLKQPNQQNIHFKETL